MGNKSGKSILWYEQNEHTCVVIAKHAQLESNIFKRNVYTWKHILPLKCAEISRKKKQIMMANIQSCNVDMWKQNDRDDQKKKNSSD